MKITHTTLVSLLILICCGCHCFLPSYDRGDVSFTFRDAVTHETITNATACFSTTPILPPYRWKKVEIQWSSASHPLNKTGRADLYNIQLFRYEVEIDAAGYDKQDSVIDLEIPPTGWVQMDFDRRFPFDKEKRIEFKCTETLNN